MSLIGSDEEALDTRKVGTIWKSASESCCDVSSRLTPAARVQGPGSQSGREPCSTSLGDSAAPVSSVSRRGDDDASRRLSWKNTGFRQPGSDEILSCERTLNWPTRVRRATS